MKHVLDFKKVAEAGPQRVSGALEVQASELNREEVERISPIRFDATAEPGDEAREFIVRGAIDFEADLGCARCLDPFPFAAHSDFSLRYRPRPAVAPANGEELEIPVEQLDEEFYDDPQVELKPIVLEQVQLSLPMKPLCEEQCQGLCPSCGTNRNREVCECGAEESDHRWDALRGIREQLARKKEI